MKRTVLCLSFLANITPTYAQVPAPGTPERAALEVQCRQEVERRYPSGTLSTRRNERQRLIDACVASGGKVS